MFIGMAITTGHVSQMFAGIGLKLLVYLCMALGAGRFNIAHGNRQRLVWVRMAAEARSQCRIFSMEGPATCIHMAGGTLGHNRIIIVLSRIVLVQLGVATHAVNLMPAPLVLDDLKNR